VNINNRQQLLAVVAGAAVALWAGDKLILSPLTQSWKERAARIVSLRDLNASAFDYCALGHYHVMRQVEDNAWYAGATDYTSTHVWQELNEERAAGIAGKGFIEWHMETRTMVPRFLRSARQFIDLPPISAEGLTVGEIDERIRATVEHAR